MPDNFIFMGFYFVLSKSMHIRLYPRNARVTADATPAVYANSFLAA